MQAVLEQFVVAWLAGLRKSKAGRAWLLVIAALILRLRCVLGSRLCPVLGAGILIRWGLLLLARRCCILGLAVRGCILLGRCAVVRLLCIGWLLVLLVMLGCLAPGCIQRPWRLVRLLLLLLLLLVDALHSMLWLSVRSRAWG